MGRQDSAPGAPPAFSFNRHGPFYRLQRRLGLLSESDLAVARARGALRGHGLDSRGAAGGAAGPCAERAPRARDPVRLQRVCVRHRDRCLRADGADLRHAHGLAGQPVHGPRHRRRRLPARASRRHDKTWQRRTGSRLGGGRHPGRRVSHCLHLDPARCRARRGWHLVRAGGGRRTASHPCGLVAPARGAAAVLVPAGPLALALRHLGAAAARHRALRSAARGHAPGPVRRHGLHRSVPTDLPALRVLAEPRHRRDRAEAASSTPVRAS